MDLAWFPAPTTGDSQTSRSARSRCFLNCRPVPSHTQLKNDQYFKMSSSESWMTAGHSLKADLQPWESNPWKAVERGTKNAKGLLYKKISPNTTASFLFFSASCRVPAGLCESSTVELSLFSWFQRGVQTLKKNQCTFYANWISTNANFLLSSALTSFLCSPQFYPIFSYKTCCNFKINFEEQYNFLFCFFG